MGGGSGEPVPKRYFTWFLRHRRQKRRCARGTEKAKQRRPCGGRGPMSWFSDALGFPPARERRFRVRVLV